MVFAMATSSLPLRLALKARPTRHVHVASFFARPAITRSVILPFCARTYATPGRPKKGSVGETSKRGRPAATGAAPKATKAAEPKAVKPKTAKPEAAKPKTPAAKAKEAKQAEVAKVKKEKAQVKREVAKVKKAKQAEVAKVKKEKARVKREAAIAKRKAAALETRGKTALKSKGRKARRAADQRKVELKELKSRALSPPARAHGSAWLAYMKARSKNAGSEGARYVSAGGAEYKALSPSQLESYKRAGDEMREQTDTKFVEWVHSHTPEHIRQANIARARLNRILSKEKSGKKYHRIPDERQVKQTPGSFAIFAHEKMPEVPGASSRQKFSEVARQWNALGDAGKQAYHDQDRANKEAYRKEFERVYGHAPGAKLDIASA